MATSTIPPAFDSVQDVPGTITTTATVTNEGLALSPEFMTEHNLTPGKVVFVTLPESRPSISPEQRLRILDELQGMFAGGPSMTDELLQQRREDDLLCKW